MSQDFSMPNDDYFITFIAERVYRGTCLTFYLTDSRKKTGWITGIDDDFIQLCRLDNQAISVVNRRHIIDFEEYLGDDSRPFKISEIKNQNTRENVLSYTKKLREKAELFKKR